MPYKGETLAVTDLLGGQVTFVLVTDSAKPFIDSGRLRLIVAPGEWRWSLFPDIPTFQEAGLEPIDPSGWLSFVAPPQLPQSELARVRATLARALAHVEVRKTLEAQGLQIVASQPAELASVARREGGLLEAGEVRSRQDQLSRQLVTQMFSYLQALRGAPDRAQERRSDWTTAVH